jgi:carotenoid cleavage dioxygenase-like enzyme
MKVTRSNPFRSTLRPSDHPYLNGAWTPLHEEADAEDLDVLEGRIPADVDGLYFRNTENPLHEARGPYHPFDGDGMIHLLDLNRGRASYRNRFVRTRGLRAEQEAGHALWGGLAARPGTSLRPGFGAHGELKDSSSTDVIVHAGQLLSTFYQCGEAYVLDRLTLEPLGLAPWVPLDGISAHPKVDLRTGELLFFNYSVHAPYMHYGVVDRNRRLTHYVPIPLPGPRLPHDMCFTERFSILNDFPVFWDPELLRRNVHAVRFYPELPSRFGIIPRHGATSELRWFEAAPTYVLHWLNAWEDGEEIVLDGYFQEDPTPPARSDTAPAYGQLMAYLDEYSFKPRLHRWRFDLRTGEERLDERFMEFGTINQAYAGRRNRYCYSALPEPGWFLQNGFVKHDLERGSSEVVRLESGRFGSEPVFAPRFGAQDEDDGYLLSFLTDENRGTSECIVIDCRRFADGPVCRIALPHKISSGTHAWWDDRPARASAARVTAG